MRTNGAFSLWDGCGAPQLVDGRARPRRPFSFSASYSIVVAAEKSAVVRGLRTQLGTGLRAAEAN